MQDLSTSLILLLLALVILWLAVTDRLSRALDAVDVLTGKATAQLTNAASPVVGGVSLTLPALPALGTMGHVDV